jgi:hypothetical protein
MRCWRRVSDLRSKFINFKLQFRRKSLVAVETAVIVTRVMACAPSCYTSFVPQKSSGEVAFSIFVQIQMKFKNIKKGIGIERRDAPKESFLPTTIEMSKYRIEGERGK